MYRHINISVKLLPLRECCMAERFDRIWHNTRLATVRGDLPELGVIERGVIAARDGRIVFAGARSDFPSGADAAERIDCAGRWITPGLVDCHTHLVFGGNRAHEFELRLQGASYEEIARAGGGIVSTVAATRAASEAELVASALPPEADGDKDRYIDLVCQEMLPAVAQAGLADAVDAFMEGIAFSEDQTAL